MSELGKVREKKMEQLQQRMEQQQEEARLQQQLQHIDGVVKQKLSKEALARYGNIKLAHPELAVQLMAVLVQLVQQRNIETITDAQLKGILKKLQPQKREGKIKGVEHGTI